jgi:hypothetical protein
MGGIKPLFGESTGGTQTTKRDNDINLGFLLSSFMSLPSFRPFGPFPIREGLFRPFYPVLQIAAKKNFTLDGNFDKMAANLRAGGGTRSAGRKPVWRLMG